MIKFENICETTQGVQVPKSEQFNEPGEGRERYLYITDMLKDSEYKYIKDEYPNKYVSSDDLVVANTGSPGKVFRGKEGILSNNLFRLTFDKGKANKDYLYYILSSEIFQTSLQKQMKGGIQKHLGHKTMGKQQIPLPQIDLQKKIAAILDAVNELRQNDKALVAKYDELTRAIFMEIFGNPVQNEKEWEIITFSKILSKIESGWSPICENKSRVNNKEWAVLKLGSVSNGAYNPKENKRYNSDVPKAKQLCEVKKGDLLFTRKNTYHLVGSTVFVHETDPKLLLPDTVFRLVYCRELTNPLFLYHLINHNNFIKEIQLLASGSSGSMPNISKAKLLEKEMIYPPLELQNKFADRVLIIEEQKAIAQKSLKKSEELFNGLLQKAFKGELV